MATPHSNETMSRQMTARLEALRAELRLGEHQLAEIDTERDKVVRTLLRISGAITVLEECLDAGDAAVPVPSSAADAAA
ncbi:hypothetical protein [Oceaniovalibus sp. ACAM 378]|jgi:hypothetical protein|uniref:hypothetical protein n=1 Tax=Oceaniovalibus sp. ACAM 378 TaxID=2599923 RepID=UPI0011D6D565|nr:hypothetical protein [Oceaniovalibus sp. ACAM 378]TYB89934.1 hypothetical protein FQ320_07430 [Oceaniovalibus sp. ACAM 378]